MCRGDEPSSPRQTRPLWLPDSAWNSPLLAKSTFLFCFLGSRGRLFPTQYTVVRSSFEDVTTLSVELHPSSFLTVVPPHNKGWTRYICRFAANSDRHSVPLLGCCRKCLPHIQKDACDQLQGYLHMFTVRHTRRRTMRLVLPSDLQRLVVHDSEYRRNQSCRQRQSILVWPAGTNASCVNLQCKKS